MDSLRLAQLMCSRLCHDLITPVGAISTGLEIMEETSEDLDSELMTLTAKSAQNAAQRLIYYRAAFGFSSIASVDSTAKLKTLLQSYLNTCNINLDWTANGDLQPETLKDHVRILINIVGIIAETAPYGGDLTLVLQGEQDDLSCDISLTGDLVGLKSDCKRALMGTLDTDDVTPHSVQSYLVRLFLDIKDASLDIQEDSKSCIRMTVKTGSTIQHLHGSLF